MYNNIKFCFQNTFMNYIEHHTMARRRWFLSSLGMCAHVPWRGWRDQRRAGRSWFFSSTVWKLGIGHRWSALSGKHLYQLSHLAGPTLGCFFFLKRFVMPYVCGCFPCMPANLQSREDYALSTLVQSDSIHHCVSRVNGAVSQ